MVGVIRVLVAVALVTVVVGKVLGRRRFSTSARPVLIVGSAFRDDGDKLVRRSFGLRVCLTGDLSALPRRRLDKSSSCTRSNFQCINLKDVDSTKLTRNVTSATTVSMRITNRRKNLFLCFDVRCCCCTFQSRIGSPRFFCRTHLSYSGARRWRFRNSCGRGTSRRLYGSFSP